MLAYNFQLALRSFKERKALTLLMVMAMSLGLGLYVTFYTMVANGSNTPHGHKARDLHLVQLDHREASADKINRQISVPNLTYRDAINLLEADMPAIRQTMVYRSFGTLSVEDPNIRPIQTRSAVTTADFFAMFEPPFLYGSGWDKSADTQGAAQIVIGKTMNQRLFGGVNSVGQTLLLENKPMKIVGVMDDWFLSWRLYDRGYQRGYPHDYYVPVNYALNQNLLRDMRFRCWSNEQDGSRFFNRENLDELLTSECAWLAFWAEFPNENRAEYQAKLNAYIAQQKETGRFPREEVDQHLLNIDEQMVHLERFTSGRTQLLMAQLFFVVCLINAVSILLAKFANRSKEVSLRRALGARKSAIVGQHVLEVMLMGLVSGAVGLAVALIGLKGMVQVRLYATDYRVRIEDILPYYELDWSLVAYAFAVSIISALLVSIYPIWRLCNQPSATMLRSQ